MGKPSSAGKKMPAVHMSCDIAPMDPFISVGAASFTNLKMRLKRDKSLRTEFRAEDWESTSGHAPNESTDTDDVDVVYEAETTADHDQDVGNHNQIPFSVGNLYRTHRLVIRVVIAINLQGFQRTEQRAWRLG